VGAVTLFVDWKDVSTVLVMNKKLVMLMQRARIVKKVNGEYIPVLVDIRKPESVRLANKRGQLFTQLLCTVIVLIESVP
jgi:hypothetical protein